MPDGQATGKTSAKILVIDDSAVARAVIARIITTKTGFTVADAVPHVRAALHFLKTTRVDAILLDIEMPGVDGLTALPQLIAAGEGARILIVSSACEGGGGATAIQALALGAADTIVKPAIGSFAGPFSDALAEKIVSLLAFEPSAEVQKRAHPVRSTPEEFDIVAIGASTGGIHALSLLLREIPPSFAVPILITQHLPTSFMPYFAAQVASVSGRPCDVATDRLRIRPGRVIIAPGDAHLRVVSLGDGTAAVRLTREQSRSGCMPSVDPMFVSVAEVFGPRALGIVLSGMGRDGSEGAKRLADAGGSVVVQDRDTSVVWGMPGAIATAQGADAILPPQEIGRLVAAGRRPA